MALSIPITRRMLESASAASKFDHPRSAETGPARSLTAHAALSLCLFGSLTKNPRNAKKIGPKCCGNSTPALTKNAKDLRYGYALFMLCSRLCKAHQARRENLLYARSQNAARRFL